MTLSKRVALRTAATVTAILVLAVGSRFGGEMGAREARNWKRVPTSSAPASLAPLARDTTELSFVVVTSANCSASQDEQLPAQLDSLRELMSTEAQRRAAIFTSVGIATDRVAADGIGALGRLGYFDEISAGRGLFGSGARHYMMDQLTGMPATPQLLVVSRSLSGATEGLVSDEVVLARLVGLSEISAWLKAGAPLNAAGRLAPVDTRTETTLTDRQ